MATIIYSSNPDMCESDDILIENHALKYGISRLTNKPLSFNAVSEKIGDKPALLMLTMLKNPNCSIFGIESAIEVMSGIAGVEAINVASISTGLPRTTRPLNFSLCSNGFLKPEVEHLQFLNLRFGFLPEIKVRIYGTNGIDGPTKGAFDLDLVINLYATVSIPETADSKRIFQDVELVSVVVEFDGPTHLSDEYVRRDKRRDSAVQGMGKTVFRLQTPYKVDGPGSTKAYKDKQELLISELIQDIKNHFSSKLFSVLNASPLIMAAIHAQNPEAKPLVGIMSHDLP